MIIKDITWRMLVETCHGKSLRNANRIIPIIRIKAQQISSPVLIAIESGREKT